MQDQVTGGQLSLSDLSAVRSSDVALVALSREFSLTPTSIHTRATTMLNIKKRVDIEQVAGR